MLKLFWATKSCLVKIGPKMAVFRNITVYILNIVIMTPKRALPYPEECLLTYFARKKV